MSSWSLSWDRCTYLGLVVRNPASSMFALRLWFCHPLQLWSSPPPRLCSLSFPGDFGSADLTVFGCAPHCVSVFARLQPSMRISPHPRQKSTRKPWPQIFRRLYPHMLRSSFTTSHPPRIGLMLNNNPRSQGHPNADPRDGNECATYFNYRHVYLLDWVSAVSFPRAYPLVAKWISIVLHNVRAGVLTIASSHEWAALFFC
ncbi:hypothetical protein C8R45DRAFT_122184 [Mycena sanguinolenta]|nr:hypothetical protein C8R45DRAFT_122184 [Mycena sanguinolenta]